jgi:hypothetical protein
MQSWKRRKSRLLAALQEGKISQAEYEFAWRETSRLVTEIERGEFKLLKVSKTHLSMIRYHRCPDLLLAHRDCAGLALPHRNMGDPHWHFGDSGSVLNAPGSCVGMDPGYRRYPLNHSGNSAGNSTRQWNTSRSLDYWCLRHCLRRAAHYSFLPIQVSGYRVMRPASTHCSEF